MKFRIDGIIEFTEEEIEEAKGWCKKHGYTYLIDGEIGHLLLNFNLSDKPRFGEWADIEIEEIK